MHLWMAPTRETPCPNKVPCPFLYVFLCKEVTKNYFHEIVKTSFDDPGDLNIGLTWKWPSYKLKFLDVLSNERVLSVNLRKQWHESTDESNRIPLRTPALTEYMRWCAIHFATRLVSWVSRCRQVSGRRRITCLIGVIRERDKSRFRDICWTVFWQRRQEFKMTAGQQAWTSKLCNCRMTGTATENSDSLTNVAI